MRNLSFFNLSVPELVAKLSDGDERVRMDAAEALGAKNDQAAFEPLWHALTNGSGRVQETTIGALARLNPAQTQIRLVGWLHGEAVETRRRAAAFLYFVADAGIFDALFAVFSADPDAIVRSNLLSALQCDPARAAQPTLAALDDPSATVRENAANLAGMLRAQRPAIEQATRPLLARLGDAEAGVRGAAAYALGNFSTYAPGCLDNTNAVETLIFCLSDADGRVREYAARSLIAIGDKRAAEPLRGLLSDGEGRVREQAARGLGRWGDDAEVIEAIVRSRETDPNEWVRKKAVESLGQIGETSKNPQIIDGLVHALADPSGEVHDAAAEALYDLRGTKTFALLVSYFSHHDPVLRASVVRALGNILSGALFDTDGFSPRVLFPLVEPLGLLLHDERADVRRGATSVLGHLPKKYAVPLLTSALADGEAEVRRAAAYSLWTAARRAALPLLIPLLHDPDARVRDEAIGGIHWVAGRQAVPFLCECLDDKDAQVRRTAAEHLRSRGDKRSLTALLAAGEKIARGEETDPAVGGYVAEALGKIGDARALPLLKRLRGMEPRPPFHFALAEAIADLEKQGETAAQNEAAP